jgi:hypothetical protein
MLKRHSDLLACRISDRSESLSSTRSTELDSQAVTHSFSASNFSTPKFCPTCMGFVALFLGLFTFAVEYIFKGVVYPCFSDPFRNPHYCPISLVLCFCRSMLFPLQCHGCAIHEIYCLDLRTQLSFGPCYSMYFASIHTIDERIATCYQNW